MGIRPRLVAVCLVALSSWGLTLPVAAGGAAFALPQTAQEATEEEHGFLDQVNETLAPVDRFWGKWVNWGISEVFFFDLWFWDNEPVLDADGQPVLDANGRAVIEKGTNLKLTVVWLVLGAVFFTLRMGFINLRGFRHAIEVVRGKYSNPDDAGEVSHFQALTAALSATVGLGNIAGVAIAVSVGGPGATFWMILAGLLGMSSKFTECSLGQMFREVRPDGRVMGGAMHYLSKGLKEKGMGGLGMALAVLFSILCIGGSFAGGNAFQVNQSLNAVGEKIQFINDYPWVYGAILTVLVAIVILGGIRRIAATAEKIVPFMCGLYIAASLFILLKNFGAIPAAFGTILKGAFSPAATYGGFLGVLIIGFQRAAFSNEAGTGSAAIAHSAARTPHPTREGIVALLEPFVDTVVVCTMTALVIVITGAYENPEYADLIDSNKGAALTILAFEEQLPWGFQVNGQEYTLIGLMLSLAIILFAYSTMISWSYYGERCWAWLFGDGSSGLYRVIFVFFVFVGSILTATNVLEFGDLMILGMALPNILGLYLLSGKAKAGLNDYWGKLQRGEFKVYK